MTRLQGNRADHHSALARQPTGAGYHHPLSFQSLHYRGVIESMYLWIDGKADRIDHAKRRQVALQEDVVVIGSGRQRYRKFSQPGDLRISNPIHNLGRRRSAAVSFFGGYTNQRAT